jgi:predicted heme/steroid binding protein
MTAKGMIILSLRTGGISLILAALLFLWPGTGEAMPPFAKATGQSCSHCHISPFGGGPLTPAGETFLRNMQSANPPIDPYLLITTGQRLTHMAAYLIHILFGVAWVGLFLYLFLPYALRQRAFPTPPRGYLRQMWYGAAVIVVAGPFLAAMKAQFVPGLFRSRFGFLLIMKILAVLLLLVATVFVTWYLMVYSSRRYRSLSERIDRGEDFQMTGDDLTLFTGRGKRRALVAVKGNLFEMTGRDLWRHGIHPGGHHAGQDLTDSFRDAPHGPEVLDRVRRVGRITEETTVKNRVTRWFFRAIFTGTAACLVILAVVALWRW